MLVRPISSSRSLLRLPIRARRVVIPHSPFQCQPANNQITGAVYLSSQRSYVTTPGRPRSTVGEPSKTVKRAVKRAARTGDGDEANATKKTTRAKGTKASKPKAKKKASIPKRELTPEQQARKDERLAKEKVRNLKRAALAPPIEPSNITAWNMFKNEKIKASMADSTSSDRPFSATAMIGESARAASQEWKNLSSADREHYNHLTMERRQAAAAEYKRWVESHTAEEIAEANRARKNLKRLVEGAGRQSRYLPIKDERAVKRPRQPFIQFAMSRQESGDFKDIPVPERAKLISQEWKALDEGEKQKYFDLASKETQNYSEEYMDVYGHAPPRTAAAAAA